MINTESRARKNPGFVRNVLHYIRIIKIAETNRRGTIYYLFEPYIIFLLYLSLRQKLFVNMFPQYPLYLLIGLMLFDVFRVVAMQTSRLFALNNEIFRAAKVNLGAFCTALVIRTYFLHLLLLIVLITITGFSHMTIAEFGIYALANIPFVIFLCGLATIFSLIGGVSSFFGDLWTVISQIFWFFTPILIEFPEHTLQILYYFNPLYYFMSFTRMVMIGAEPALPTTILICAVAAVCALTIGVAALLKNKLYPLALEGLA